jgi:Family of unknown function (DUF6519)
MKADLTRITFDPFKHFARVLTQQGRVQLDADWNEQAAILLHYLHGLAADLIGQHGGPTDHLGYAISLLETGAPPQQQRDFIIGAGHYYIDGILCEVDAPLIPITGFVQNDRKKPKVLYWPLGNLAFRQNQYVEASEDPAKPDEAPTTVRARIMGVDAGNRTLTLDQDIALDPKRNPRVRRLTTYLTQADYPGSAQDLGVSKTYLAYLDVWERLITYVEDDAIRETALGGPDTTARSKIVSQVKLLEQDNANCLDPQQLSDLFQPLNRGWLRAMAKQDSTSTDPCIIPPRARYRGPENQLYRVEIHRGGTIVDNPTFKWSRENGSVIYPIVSVVSGGGTSTVTLENSGRDERFGLVEGDWVEIVDDDYVLQNRAGNLLRVKLVVSPSMTVTLDGTPPAGVGSDAAKHPLLRRWDHKAGDPDEGGLELASDGAARVVEGSGEQDWLELEDGVKIEFQKPDDEQRPNHYRTGDYWLIPARTATGDVEWPRYGDNQPLARPPDGVTHHYAPLQLITVKADGSVSVDQSCQKSFSSLTGAQGGAQPARRGGGQRGAP